MEDKMHNNRPKEDWYDYGARLTGHIGAFHLSKSFDFETCAESSTAKQTAWLRSMRLLNQDVRKIHIWENSPRKVTVQDYTNMLTGVWVQLDEALYSQMQTLIQDIVGSVQELAPGLGMTKSLIALLMSMYDSSDMEVGMAPVVAGRKRQRR